MNCGSVFSGIGLLDYGLSLAGIEHQWLCEADEWRRGILAKRWPGAHIFDDVRTVDGRAGRPVLVAGGFPCRGTSSAGKQEGLDHPETALWAEMFRVVRELRPRYVLIENVANLLAIHGGAVWGTVLGDLASIGYDVEWDVLPAAAFGAPHLRERVFAIATEATVLGHERSRGAWAGRDGFTDGGELAPDAARLREGGPGAEARADRERTGEGAYVAADATSGPPGFRTTDTARGLATEPDGSCRVEWGDYEPAIRRWEAVHGPAPEPLIRGVDDRGTARVVRSRLSALGDGVQVQAGYFMGRLLMAREAERIEQAA